MVQPTRAAGTRAATLRPAIGGEPKGRLEIDVSSLPKELEATWIREEVRGEYESDNVASALERGYRPVEAKELPQYAPRILPGARGSAADTSLIRRGGMVLMARERRLAEEERSYHAAETAERTRSVAREVSQQMAPKDGVNFQDLDPEISVKTSRGRGRFSEQTPS